MALNLEVLEVLEDIDPTSRQPRIRARVRELKPRMHLVNLKNCDAEQISTIKNNVGAVLSLPGREMMMDGRFILSIPQSEEEFFVVRPAAAVAVSKTVDLSAAVSMPAVSEVIDDSKGAAPLFSSSRAK